MSIWCCTYHIIIIWDLSRDEMDFVFHLKSSMTAHESIAQGTICGLLKEKDGKRHIMYAYTYRRLNQWSVSLAVLKSPRKEHYCIYYIKSIGISPYRWQRVCEPSKRPSKIQQSAKHGTYLRPTKESRPPGRYSTCQEWHTWRGVCARHAFRISS